MKSLKCYESISFQIKIKIDDLDILFQQIVHYLSVYPHHYPGSNNNIISKLLNHGFTVSHSHQCGRVEIN